MDFKLLSILIACGVFGAVQSVDVVCYYGSWSAYDGTVPENFNASLCTHVNYAFITLWENGNLKVEDDGLDLTQGLFYRLTDMKKRNTNLKALLSVGGPASGDLFRAVASDSDKRGAFIGSASYFISTYAFDGLDINWENIESRDKDNFISLLRETKASFDSNGWLLTASVSAQPGDGYDYGQMSNYLDFINVRSYDFYGSWSAYTGQNSALYGSSVESDYEKSTLNIEASANSWVNAGIPKSKLSIGTAFYGRSFQLQDNNNNGLHAPISGAGNDGGTSSYSTICTQDSGWTRVWDDEQKSPYRYSGNQWIGYDDKDSIWAKAYWIKQNGFNGVSVYSIDQDDVSGACDEAQILLQQVNRAINYD